MKFDTIDIMAAVGLLLILVLSVGMMLGMEISENHCKVNCPQYNCQ